MNCDRRPADLDLIGGTFDAAGLAGILEGPGTVEIFAWRVELGKGRDHDLFAATSLLGSILGSFGGLRRSLDSGKSLHFCGLGHFPGNANLIESFAHFLRMLEGFSVAACFHLPD